MIAQTAHANVSQSVIFLFLFFFKVFGEKNKGKWRWTTYRHVIKAYHESVLIVVLWSTSGFFQTSSGKTPRAKNIIFPPLGLHLISYYGYKIHSVAAYMHIHMSF